MTIKPLIPVSQQHAPDSLREWLSDLRPDYTTPESILHVLWISESLFCGVFGDPDNASYEWFIFDEKHPERIARSNSGFGDSPSALHEVLTHLKTLRLL